MAVFLHALKIGRLARIWGNSPKRNGKPKIFFSNVEPPPKLVRASVFSQPSLQNHAPRDTHTDDIGPSLQEIEKMRVKQGSDDVLDHNDQTNPGDEVISSEQH